MKKTKLFCKYFSLYDFTSGEGLSLFDVGIGDRVLWVMKGAIAA